MELVIVCGKCLGLVSSTSLELGITCTDQKFTEVSFNNHWAVVLFQGNMMVTVTYGGDQVPKSPFTVNVAPPLDLNKVKVQGLNNSKHEHLVNLFCHHA